LQAISAAEEALRHEQHNPNIFSYLGRASLALAHQEDHASERLPLSERALKAFDQARRLAPLEEAYPLEMALVFDELARFNEAEAMFELARSRDPRSETIAQMYQAHRDAWENAKHETSAPD
jgi:tetratricopeptide (TPR) repeat protein